MLQDYKVSESIGVTLHMDTAEEVEWDWNSGILLFIGHLWVQITSAHRCALFSTISYYTSARTLIV